MPSSSQSVQVPWDGKVCPNCVIGTLEPNEGETIARGPYTSTCDRCGWTMTQSLDAPRDVTVPRDHY